MATETRIQFYVGRSPINAALAARADERLSPSEVAKRDLDRYYALLARSLPTFTEPEASLIVDALNGLVTQAHSAALVSANVIDAIRLDGLDAKWGVDGAALRTRLAQLTPFEQLAIADASERFWMHPELDIDENLRRVGLVRPLIVRTPETCGGQPRIDGTRITVEVIQDMFAAGADVASIQATYTHLSAEQIHAALEWPA